jgi:hypothetical protein
MKPTDKAVVGNANNPMLPIAWTRTYTGAAGKPASVFTTTLGCAEDLQSEGIRRLLVNACYWAMGMEDRIMSNAPVDLIGPYLPSKYGPKTLRLGLTPQALQSQLGPLAGP